MKQFRATLLTFDTVSESIQKKIDARIFDFNTEFNVCFESYSVPLKISVLNEYADKIVNYMTLQGCIITQPSETYFRASDYTFVQNGSLYNVSCECRDIQDHIERYITSYNLDMNPSFQRGYVWIPEQKKNYIEYLLSGGISGREIYFNVPNWMSSKKRGDMVLVDGKQRLSAIIDFINGKFPIFDGVYFNDLNYRDVSNIKLKFNVNNITDMKDVITWYISMNKGGSVHTEEDLKSAYVELNKLIN